MATAQKPRIKRNSKRNTNNIERKGSGWYVFKNHKKCELMLPKVTSKGVKSVAYNETWEGDDYYFLLVRSRLAQLVREVPIEELNNKPEIFTENTVEDVEKDEKKINETLSISNEFPEKPAFPNQENEVNQEISENEQKKEEIMSEKLLLDQAPCITNQGTVEQVVVQPEESGIVILDNFKPKKNKKAKEQKINEVLFNESPIEGIQILN
jgi:hypothetical protein